MDKYFKSIDRNKWIRNPQWIQFPADNGLDNKAYAILAVFDDAPTIASFATKNITEIDWGDGSPVSTLVADNSFNTDYHIYDYSTITGPVLKSFDNRNYKNVMVELTCDSSVGEVYVDWGDDNAPGVDGGQVTHWLDIDVRFAGTSTSVNTVNSYYMRINSQARAYYLERFKAKYPVNSAGATRMFYNASRLAKFEVHSDFFNYLTNGNQAALRGVGQFADVVPTLPNINNSNFQSSTAFFRNSSKFRLQEFRMDNCTDFNVAGIHNMLQGCGDVIMPICTNTRFMFGGTVGRTLPEGIGIIDTPLVENISSMFEKSLVSDIEWTDCSNVTSASDVFYRTGNIRRLIMPGLTVSVDVNNNILSETAINNFFTSLGTADGTQTIDVSNNPGAATCDTSIATAKGWTVIT